MPYTPPIFDRTQSDINAKTSKAYLNIVDWQRIYDNSLFVRDFLVTEYGIPITFDTLTTPTTASIPPVEDMNKLAGNIERIRLNSGIIGHPGVVVIKDDWIAGAAASAPDFENVNDWEEVMDIIYLAVQKALLFQKKCGVSTSGQSAWRQNFFRRY